MSDSIINVTTQEEIIEIKTSRAAATKISTQENVIEIGIKEQKPISIVSSGEGPRGPRGFPGEPGLSPGDSTFTIFTHEPIGAQRLIASQNGICVYADSLNDLPALGISIVSAPAFEFIECQSIGSILVPGANWIKDDLIFLANNGLFTQEIPTTGFNQSVGRAVDTNKIIIKIAKPIYF